MQSEPEELENRPNVRKVIEVAVPEGNRRVALASFLSVRQLRMGTELAGADDWFP